MALIPVTASVILAGAGLGDDVDARARIVGVFSLITVEQHLDFGDSVEVDGAAEKVGTAQVVAAHAVHVDDAEHPTPALNVGDLTAAAAAPTGLALPLKRDAGQDSQQRDDIAPSDRDRFQLLRRDQRRVFGALRLHRSYRSVRGYRFTQLADDERYITYG